MMQLGDLGRQDDFNYELQSTQFRDEEAVVRHGDVVTTTCVYNSRTGLRSLREVWAHKRRCVPTICSSIQGIAVCPFFFQSDKLCETSMLWEWAIRTM